MSGLLVSDEVGTALAEGRAVVALESTVYSTLGLPPPVNDQALQGCLAAVRAAGAVPAVTAVLDGELRVGLDEVGHERILTATDKLAERDLGPAVATGLAAGVTTVSASLTLARAAGVAVFATGGIGGVHRGAASTGDVSADLDALARHPLVVVSAGAKAFLDLPRTVEDLETRGVAVLGWRTDDLPAFWSRASGLGVTRRVDDAEAVAAAWAADRRLGRPQGLLLANPVPAEAEWPREEAVPAIEAALAAAAAAGVRGAAVTPFVLARLAEAEGERTLPANLALVVDDARVAGLVAVAVAALADSGKARG